MIIIITFLIFTKCLRIFSFSKFQFLVWFLFFIFPLRLILISSLLAETNRTPFDLSEGESELVSGFNVEYRRGSFALIFLAEYSRILFIRFLICFILIGGNYFSLLFYFKFLLVSFF